MGTYTMTVFLSQDTITIDNFFPEKISMYTQMCLPVCLCVYYSLDLIFSTQRYFVLCYSSPHDTEVVFFKYFNYSPTNGHLI